MLFANYGTESGGCNVFVQGQADRWLVCDVKNPGPRMAQITPFIAIRERADGVCAEDARRCWLVHVVASGRTITSMAERNCGGASGREKAFHVDRRAAFKAVR